MPYIVLIIIFLIIAAISTLFIKYIMAPVSSNPIDDICTPEDIKPSETTVSHEPLLVICPACGTQISRYATSCIKCGHPISPVQTPHTTYPAYKERAQKESQQTVIIQQGSQSNGVGTAGFVLSLLSLIFSWVPGIGWFVWFLGFLLSFIGMFKSPRGLAVTGFLISIIDLLILITIIGSLATLLSL